jgi:hypothetical protein
MSNKHGSVMGLFIGQGVSRTDRSPVFITAAALLVLLTVGVAFTAHWYIVQRTETLADEMMLATQEVFESVLPFTNADASALRQYPNRIHVERARELGIPRIADRDAAEAIKYSAGLVMIEDTPHYLVQPMSYSIPYVTEDAAHLLDIIGARFQARLADLGLPPFRYVITSATRTSADQTRLRRVNANAAEVSSHFHGTTVDIHYARFNYDVSIDSLPESPMISTPILAEALDRRYSAMTEEYQPQLKSLLGEVMQEVQREGLVMVTYERLQPVYHITVAQRIEGPDVVAAPPPPIVARAEEAVEVVAPAR